jgi:ketosteroid isomerase-like protein
MEDEMTLEEIAKELVAGCKEGREKENLHKLYAPDAVSVESLDMGGGRETKGVDAILGKHHWWDSTFIVHKLGVEGPFTHGEESFAVIFEMDTENRESKDRRQDREVAVYHVKDGRITREEFYYST